MQTSLSLDEEAKRLAALDKYHVLDSLPEQEYEDITQLAAQICGTPITLISLVDEKRQWFKANQGLPVHQTPREQSFCAHNLVNPNGPLIVEDARLDERFVDNPLVTGDPHIVFYAGIPLVDPQGHVLGSLCVIDQQVRRLTPDQLGALNGLARQVMSLLKLRQTNQALLEAQQSIDRQKLDIDFALQAVGLGVWEVDMTTNLVIWDDRCRALFGIAKQNPLPYEQAIRYIHPEDVKRVDEAVGWANLDSHQTLLSLKGSSNYKRIPVVMMSGDTTEREINDCYEVGVSSFLKKEMDFVALKTMVEQVCHYWLETNQQPVDV